MKLHTVISLFVLFLTSAVVMAQDLEITGGEGILIDGEGLETLWEEGGFKLGSFLNVQRVKSKRGLQSRYKY